jgi:hypothetical protein
LTKPPKSSQQITVTSVIPPHTQLYLSFLTSLSHNLLKNHPTHSRNTKKFQTKISSIFPPKSTPHPTDPIQTLRPINPTNIWDNWSHHLCLSFVHQPPVPYTWSPSYWA